MGVRTEKGHRIRTRYIETLQDEDFHLANVVACRDSSWYTERNDFPTIGYTIFVFELFVTESTRRRKSTGSGWLYSCADPSRVPTTLCRLLVCRLPDGYWVLVTIYSTRPTGLVLFGSRRLVLVGCRRLVLVGSRRLVLVGSRSCQSDDRWTLLRTLSPLRTWVVGHKERGSD